MWELAIKQNSRVPKDWRRSHWPVALSLLVIILALACNSTSTPAGERPTRNQSGGEEMVSRFLIGGWAFPLEEQESQPDPFAEILRTFVLTSEEEMREFLEELDLIRLRGNLQTLDNVDFTEDVVLAAYYLWRPLKGDPLFMQTVTLTDNELGVLLELEEDPQGRESPYLLAPFLVAAIDREPLPKGVPFDLIWRLNGETATTMGVQLD